MKVMLYGDGGLVIMNNMRLDNEVNPEIVSQLSQEIYQADLLQHFVGNLSKFEFEVCSWIVTGLRRKKMLHKSSTTCLEGKLEQGPPQ